MGRPPEVIEPTRDERRELQMFVVGLGAALNASGQPAYVVQDRLTRVAHAYDARGARVSAFPTYLIVTMGRGRPATLELTSVAATPRLDQISAVDRLVHEAELGTVPPADGLRRLDEIDSMRARFRKWPSVVGYSVLTLGLCLLLQPPALDVAAAAVLGALVGVLRSVGSTQPALQVLVPLVAAFSVSALSALAVKHDLTDPGLRAMVASLIVFLPGTALTTAVLELNAGQMVSGSSRLVSGVMQLALLTFGIIAGIEAVGVPTAVVFSDPADLLGDWAPWVGVLVFAVGVTVANSAPTRSFPGLLIVLYAAWGGQVLGNALFGGYVSAFVGALVMTPVAAWVSRLRSAMPQQASFLPGFWLLVPGALGLIGLTQLVGDADEAGTADLVATVVSIFAVAIGVLCGTLLIAWGSVTGKLFGGVSDSIGGRSMWLSRAFRRSGSRRDAGDDGADGDGRRPDA